MKKLLTKLSVTAIAVVFCATAFGQSPTATRQRRTTADGDTAVQSPAAKSDAAAKPDNHAKSADANPQPSPAKPDDKTKSPAAGQALPNRAGQDSDEAAIVQNYNNFFATYKLGPEDIISVMVFAQDRYSKSGIKVPPSGRISLALIPEGIFVTGKTVDEVAELVKKRYDEYIIDPQVSVSLDQAGSYRYSVIGEVGQPGIRLMTRRLSVTEALAEAGGVLQTGNKKSIFVLRKQANGNLARIPVNVSAIYKGAAPDAVYLMPGDQVIVPGNRWKTFDKVASFLPIVSFARIFTGGF